MGIRKYRGQIVCDKRWPDGERITRRCKNRTKAKELLSRIEASIADGNWKAFRETLRLRHRQTLALNQYFEIYFDDYVKVRNKRKTVLRKKTSMKRLQQYLGNVSLEDITPARVHSYIRWRKSKGVTDATVNRDLTMIKHMLNYAEECGMLASSAIDKFRLLREEQKERRRFTEGEIQSVLEAVHPDCRPLFVFIRETGCRREEALSLQHHQIQEEAQLVVFSEDTKSRRFRYVPLTEVALEAVKAQPPFEDCPYVFYNGKTRTRWGRCRKPWVNAREAAGVGELQVKDLRRHYAIRLAEDGADMHDIQQVLGHASVATTEKYYAQFSPKHSAKKILKVLQGGQFETETKRKHANRELAKASGEN